MNTRAHPSACPGGVHTTVTSATNAYDLMRGLAAVLFIASFTHDVEYNGHLFVVMLFITKVWIPFQPIGSGSPFGLIKPVSNFPLTALYCLHRQEQRRGIDSAVCARRNSLFYPVYCTDVRHTVF